jgi:hypothetical protein
MSDAGGPEDPLEFFRKMWNPMSFPLPGVFQPTMNIEDVEKKIAELQAVENWLKMNLSMLQVTIKTLEMQRDTLRAIHESTGRASDSK